LTASQASFDQIELIKKNQLELDALSQIYRPLHQQVASIKRQLAMLDKHIVEFEKEDKTAHKQREIDQLQAQKLVLTAQIPLRWEGNRNEYMALVKQDRKARLDYRRSGSEAYETIRSISLIIGDGQPLSNLRSDVLLLTDAAQRLDAKTAMAHIKVQEKALGKLHGTSAIKGLLSKARRALKGKNASVEKSQDLISQAIIALDTEVNWRQQAMQTLVADLDQFVQSISTTIGLRSLEQLPREQALYVASCNSGHRDISLIF
ncbi:MAG: hypothetical protein QGI54_00450, partial [Gammaproteobacteria bacterium]|nr:hypothetical protein [Gammaproteobacteria bacterium]